MDDETRRDAVAASIESPSTPAVLTRIAARLWPGGPADRSLASSREWLRRWAPTRLDAPAVVCGCSGGRCAVCN